MAFDPDKYIQEKGLTATFNPDKYLQEKGLVTPTPEPFNPDKYIAEKAAAPTAPPPVEHRPPTPAEIQAMPITPSGKYAADAIPGVLPTSPVNAFDRAMGAVMPDMATATNPYARTGKQMVDAAQSDIGSLAARGKATYLQDGITRITELQKLPDNYVEPAQPAVGSMGGYSVPAKPKTKAELIAQAKVDAGVTPETTLNQMRKMAVATSQGADILTNDPAQEEARQAAIDKAQGLSGLASGARGTFAAAGRSALETLPLAALPGGLPAAIALGTAVTGNQAITQGAEAGVSGQNALASFLPKGSPLGTNLGAFAGTQAGIEGALPVLFERFAPGLEKILAKNPAIKLGFMAAAKQLGIGTLQEIPEEVITTVLQDANQQQAGVTKDPAYWQDALSTALQVAATGGLAAPMTLGGGAVQDISGATKRQADQIANLKEMGYTDSEILRLQKGENVPIPEAWIQQGQEQDAQRRAAIAERLKQTGEPQNAIPKQEATGVPIQPEAGSGGGVPSPYTQGQETTNTGQTQASETQSQVEPQSSSPAPGVSPTPSSAVQTQNTPSLSAKNEGAGGDSKQPWEMTKEELATQKDETGLTDIEDRFAFHVGGKQEDGLKAKDWGGQNVVWLKKGGILHSMEGSVYAVDLSKILPENLSKHKNGFTVHKGDIPKNAVVPLGEYKDTGVAFDTHKAFVESALSSGKPVPAAVLADYPDLAEKYGKRDGAGGDLTQPNQPAGLPNEQPAVASPSTESGGLPVTPQEHVAEQLATKPEGIHPNRIINQTARATGVDPVEAHQALNDSLSSGTATFDDNGKVKPRQPYGADLPNIEPTQDQPVKPEEEWVSGMKIDIHRYAAQLGFDTMNGQNRTDTFNYYNRAYQSGKTGQTAIENAMKLNEMRNNGNMEYQPSESEAAGIQLEAVKARQTLDSLMAQEAQSGQKPEGYDAAVQNYQELIQGQENMFSSTGRILRFARTEFPLIEDNIEGILVRARMRQGRPLTSQEETAYKKDKADFEKTKTEELQKEQAQRIEQAETIFKAQKKQKGRMKNFTATDFANALERAKEVASGCAGS